MGTVDFFIDGFNVYHALQGNPAYRKYKWLDYAALARCYVGGNDQVGRVNLYTAFTTWNAGKVARHREFLKAQCHQGVDVVLGHFKIKDKYCTNCRTVFRTPVEKRTDVNIAIGLFVGAHLNSYDRAILITGDTDVIPSIEAVKRIFPMKQVGIVIPLGRRSEEIKLHCDFHFRMNENQLSRSQLPNPLVLGPGVQLHRPVTWT
ncbi:MAG: NYN domain-containing protein [Candidatus Sumerlaeia bacterium]|nr:NYN domain-containing protein [Candidatus Sumerlaeia bacterium]